MFFPNYQICIIPKLLAKLVLSLDMRTQRFSVKAASFTQPYYRIFLKIPVKIEKTICVCVCVCVCDLHFAFDSWTKLFSCGNCDKKIDVRVATPVT